MARSEGCCRLGRAILNTRSSRARIASITAAKWPIAISVPKQRAQQSREYPSSRLALSGVEQVGHALEVSSSNSTYAIIAGACCSLPQWSHANKPRSRSTRSDPPQLSQFGN